MTRLTDGEQIVALQTKMDTVIENQKSQATDFKLLNANLNQLLPTFALKKEVEKELEKLKKQHSLQTWLVGTLSLALGAIITALAQGYLNK